MLTSNEYLDTFVFLTLASIGTSVIFKYISNKKRALWFSCGLLVAIFAVQEGMRQSSRQPNLYAALEVDRLASHLDIRKGFKEMSKKLHPDRNTMPNADEAFTQMSESYQILIDETQREIYNIFGNSKLDFDPRNDETRLLASTMFTYLVWLGCTYLFTIPESAQASRVWVTVLIIWLFVLEAFFIFSGLTVPAWFPLRHTTEFEVLRFCHLSLPLLMGLLKAVAQSVFVNVDDNTNAALAFLIHNNKVMDELLSQLQTLQSIASVAAPTPASESEQEDVHPEESLAVTAVEAEGTTEVEGEVEEEVEGKIEVEVEEKQATQVQKVDKRMKREASKALCVNCKRLSSCSADVVAAANKVAAMRLVLQKNHTVVDATVKHLVESRSTLGEKYYWLVFVFMYGAVFFAS